MKPVLFVAWGALCLIHTSAFARGVSPYLPLHLEPEIERQIERVLILADKPVLKRPIAAATVLDALPKACEVDAELCAEVRHYLHRYMGGWGVSHASVEGAVTDGPDLSLPNRHGLASSSAWQASASAYWQPSDYLIATIGGIAYEGDSTPTNSMLSLGFDSAQLDLGYRDHWFSPFTDSSMLISTEAPTMPSATVSNYRSLTRLGLQYEFFVAQMSKAPILFQNEVNSGYPRLAGFHLALEPVSGWSIAINRVMQFGGGGREKSISDFLNAFFRPSPSDNQNDDLTQDQEFGNQVGAITSRFLFPGKTPFAIYFEYAGEDASRGGFTTFGNASLSAGIHFPRLWRRFDLTYEASQWQNGWYVHSIYQGGLANEGNVIGHWGGDQRQFGDGVGAQSQMLRVGWQPAFGGTIQLQYRTLANESYSSAEYSRSHDVALSYARPWGPLVVGGELLAGKDVFGESVSRLAAFVRYTESLKDGYHSLGTTPSTVVEAKGTEMFVDAGVNAYEIRLNPDSETAQIVSSMQVSPHVGIGARRAVSARNDLGARVELDDFDGHTLVALRALDYRYRFTESLALSFFIGAATYQLGTPAIGSYGGIGAQWRNVLPNWDAGLDLRFVSNAARDRLLASDPAGSRPDIFYDIPAATLYISRRF
jgi:hypothetical protein